MYSELFPILLTRDVGRALAFYRDRLGASVTFEFPGPGGEPAYVGLELGSSQLGIGLGAEMPDAPLPRSISLWVYAESCDEAVAGLRAAGTPILSEPADQPWGERIARVLDPDGNEVVIGQRAAGSPEAGGEHGTRVETA